MAFRGWLPNSGIKKLFQNSMGEAPWHLPSTGAGLWYCVGERALPDPAEIPGNANQGNKAEMSHLVRRKVISLIATNLCANPTLGPFGVHVRVLISAAFKSLKVGAEWGDWSRPRARQWTARWPSKSNILAVLGVDIVFCVVSTTQSTPHLRLRLLPLSMPKCWAEKPAFVDGFMFMASKASARKWAKCSLKTKQCSSKYLVRAQLSFVLATLVTNSGSFIFAMSRQDTTLNATC